MGAEAVQDGRESAVRDRRRRQPKTSEVIAREIARSIIDDDLPAGAMLPTEDQMREDYGVGRSTLREALLLLETRGVITVKSGPRGGPVVRRPRPADLSEALTLILQFERGSLREVLEARKTLEPPLARLAARRMTAERLSQLQGTVDAIFEDLDSNEVFLRENERFHALIAEAAGNTVLGVFSESLKSIADGARFGVEYTRTRHKAVAAAHQRIIEALRDGDEDAAAAAMSTHIDEAGRYWERKYRDLVTRPLHWAH